MSEVRYFWTAVMLLTRLPTPRLDDYQDPWLARSAVWFPAVGLIVGCLAAGVYAAASVLWSEPVAAVLGLTAGALVTGGLHEDGWADLFDALAAGGDRRRMLEVMKDSRIGAAGGLALLLLLLGKLSALASLPTSRAATALIAAHILSRWSHLPLLGLPYARPEGGMAGPLAGRIPKDRMAAGTLFTVLTVVGILQWKALPALAAAGLATLASSAFFRRRFGGITGDCLGAANQLVELSVFLAVAASLGWK